MSPTISSSSGSKDMRYGRRKSAPPGFGFCQTTEESETRLRVSRHRAPLYLGTIVMRMMKMIN